MIKRFSQFGLCTINLRKATGILGGYLIEIRIQLDGNLHALNIHITDMELEYSKDIDGYLDYWLDSTEEHFKGAFKDN